MISHPRHRAGLDALAARDRLRARAPATGLDFASNDYLGLAGSDLLKQAALDALGRGVPVGAAMSMPLCGLRACPLNTRRRPNELERRPGVGCRMCSEGRAWWAGSLQVAMTRAW